MKKSKFFKFLTSKFLLVCFLLLIELSLLPTLFIFLSLRFPNGGMILSILLGLADLIAAICIINSPNMNSEYKIAWIVPILLLPPIGILLFLMLRKRKLPHKRREKLIHQLEGSECLYVSEDRPSDTTEETDLFAVQCADYLSKQTGMAFSSCTDFKYFPIGEEYAKQLIIELEKAEKYIFMEYFIIQPGQFFDEVLKILTKKAQEGVDVRLIYDDIGCMFKIPDNYAEQLESMGIKCLRFNPFRPVLDVAQNNRSHRKIVSIDGKTAFTGGINLADEYVNVTHPFQHWKDTGVMVHGRVAQHFTAMFLQLWALREEKEDFQQYVTDLPVGECRCMAFSDTPLGQNENICENLYLKLIYNAKKYIYINTPYLIPDEELRRALITAAKAGVDVRITVPHIADKKYIFAVTKAFYSDLMKEGIKIYRYTPGFIHAKSIVCDDKYCIIGSSNTDFRSFYLNFECDIIFFNEQISKDVSKDFLETTKVSHLVTKDDVHDGIFRLIYRSLLRIFAPLM